MAREMEMGREKEMERGEAEIAERHEDRGIK
jgi:hypothetical protein